MSAQNDGGPAFPSEKAVYNADGKRLSGPPFGMSLRDYFAAAALTVVAQSFASPDLVAEMAYQYADALLAERAKGGEQ